MSFIDMSYIILVIELVVPFVITLSIQKTMLANVSDKVIEWSLDLDCCGPAVEAGNFRFVRESGAPFLTHNGGGVCGKLNPGETFELGVFFCPGQSTASVIEILLWLAVW